MNSRQGSLGLVGPLPDQLLTAGVDEAGRGPLAGAVYAAAVILPGTLTLAGLNDSKRINAATRERLDQEIRGGALAWAIGTASVAEIEQINILRASLLAMERAIAGLDAMPGLVFVDGTQTPQVDVPAVAVPGGDACIAAISAASVLAKVARDRAMVELDERYPGYGFARHKGYGSRAHLQALQQLGPCPAHRRTFAPVAKLINGGAARQLTPDLTGLSP